MDYNRKNNYIKKDFPSKKDLVYWIFILIVFISVIVAWRTSNPETLLNQISLGSTFLSILLAVIAIFFSFIHSNESSRQSSDLLKEMNKVTNEIVSLNGLREDLLKTVEKYEKTIDEYTEKAEKLEDKNIDDTEDIKSIKKEFKEAIENINSDYQSKLKRRKFLLKFILYNEEFDLGEFISVLMSNPMIRKTSFRVSVKNDLVYNSVIHEVHLDIQSYKEISHEDIYKIINENLDSNKAKFLGVFHVG
ncbi:hypothetical protein SAMN05421743_12150 [Thalassobacillus cyri]|uniref:Uncharacterized protein n=1 Tax=Thalassobacillus cyri TaxID=571932 RepID=A0A1H4H1V7_9BACI|nr:hypothetical protein [Thalassobacillus cyri]SEB15825.1 hypothetical protein SAMN05421743_12150 [Thalassobacillus cyri]